MNIARIHVVVFCLYVKVDRRRISADENASFVCDCQSIRRDSKLFMRAETAAASQTVQLLFGRRLQRTEKEGLLGKMICTRFYKAIFFFFTD
jgi:hypothetical protein